MANPYKMANLYEPKYISMEILINHFDSQDMYLIQSMDRHGNTICTLSKNCKEGKRDLFTHRFTLAHDGLVRTFSRIDEAICAFVYHSAACMAALNHSKFVDGYTLYAYDFDNKLHCDESCHSSTRHDPKIYTVHIHRAFQQLQGGVMCKDCYDSESNGPSLKYLYELWLNTIAAFGDMIKSNTRTIHSIL